MDYEKKYKEALENARQEYNTTENVERKQWLEELFPELAESEDEKIRKELIKVFSNKEKYIIDQSFGDITIAEVLTWLEKQAPMPQGKTALEAFNEEKVDNANKVEPKFNVGDTMRTWREANNGYTDGMPVVVSIDNEYYHCTNELIAIKDQDAYEFPPINVKQKPADKVEPKFKTGQWIVWQDKCYKVNYNGCGYELVDKNGLSTSLEYGTIDENAYFWTIQDAKDGDVLVVNGKPFIYYHTDEYKGNYCCIDYIGCFRTNIRFSFEGNCILPATKEQRDLLFQKMREAGYEWDAEKKELRKIEKQDNKKEINPTLQEKERMDDTFTKMMLKPQVDGFEAELNALLKKYEYLPKHELADSLEFYLGVVRDDLDVVREDKPKWTEEDEKTFIEKKIRQETCCGLHDASIYFEELLNAIKRRPVTTLDKNSKIKITWI